MSKQIWRVQRGKKLIGNWHTTLAGGVRVNLRTKDATLALKRRAEARKSGKTDFRDDIGGAAAETIAALDVDAASMSNQKKEGVSPVESGDSIPSTAGVPADQPHQAAATSAAQSPGAGPVNWADAANAAAGAVPADADTAANGPQQPEPAPSVMAANLTLADLPFLEGAFVSVSKLFVHLQLGTHAWVAKKRGFRLGIIEDQGPPPTTLKEYMEREAMPWPASDPREPGRQIWEHFLRRICPKDIPIPDYALAPLVVFATCAPAQLAGMSRIDPQQAPPPSNDNNAAPAGAPPST